MARQVDKVAVIGLEASQSQCCKRGRELFKLPQLVRGCPRVPNSTKLLATLIQIEKNTTAEEEMITEENQASSANKKKQMEQLHPSESHCELEKAITSTDIQLIYLIYQ
ncbi:hypothetical protein E2C01_074398 [Portunus trituberculatus]|uniref:Uncharacterized protein n=1 Tax=Portunus trituberculatus TaxID=210409 RepID=A0A5B7IE69_PORTR|nr:hypothetical protein [Portunus trituberculatus]